MTEERMGMEAVRDAEAAVLGSLLIDPDSILRVRDLLKAEMFSSWKNQTLFTCFLDLDDKRMPADIVGVNWWIADHGHKNEIPPHEITDLVQSTPSAMHVEHYARIVVDAYRMRKLEQILTKGVQGLYVDGADLDAIQAEIQDAMLSNGSQGEDALFIADMVGGVVDKIRATTKARAEGMEVGIKFKLSHVDAILGGLRAGDFLLLAGRPGMGKTTAALQFLLKVAEDNLPVVVYTLEMGQEQLILKFISSLTGIPYNRLRSGDVYQEEEVFIDAAHEHLSRLPIAIVDGCFTIESISNHARRFALRHGEPYLVVVDYLQLVTSEARGLSGNQNALVSHISRTFKQLARSMGCPIVALSQLSRAVENRSDKRPVLSDLRDSGTLEQDADQVVFLFRQGYYDETCETPNLLEWLVRKNRHGATGTASTFFRLETGVITDVHVERTDLDY